jgi:hypothetical protein
MVEGTRQAQGLWLGVAKYQGVISRFLVKSDYRNYLSLSNSDQNAG